MIPIQDGGPTGFPLNHRSWIMDITMGVIRRLYADGRPTGNRVTTLFIEPMY
ncbi:hypothetical protein KFK09_013162 [Dendrobium nobile]|uniref:Uncharacterized protein n=1 Tax=Dendrobium nobile TaxID=94219 RepID=A0A8T3B7X4_DENNO|nr:hypothetical protein KFK09_013162 [Dendrobium nobile]